MSALWFMTDLPNLLLQAACDAPEGVWPIYIYIYIHTSHSLIYCGPRQVSGLF
jgi:hypothetical protein